ncbi:hypothetical protein A2U01_0098263, partial [Trifolium medium]|nr:hypothetical protein [Trifolium medium]
MTNDKQHAGETPRTCRMPVNNEWHIGEQRRRPCGTLCDTSAND